MPSSASAPPSHLVRYDDDRALIRFMFQVTDDSVMWLADEIDLAISYYSMRYIDVHLVSPGGSVDSLLYLLQRFKEWRQNDEVTIGTLALTNVSSAAAAILSLAGNIGHRRACSSSRLLYHDARIVTNGAAVWTQTNLALEREALASVDEQILRELASYVWASRESEDAPLRLRAPDPNYYGRDMRFREVEVTKEDDLVAIYADLGRRDTPITPMDAIGLRLVDRLEA